MTFLNYCQNIKFKKDKNDQKGITLLLAIVLLAAILSISFSITTILFIEIRVSGDLTRTEASLYAANGVSEQEVYNLKRDVCTSTTQNCAYIGNFNNGVSISGQPTVSSTSSPVIVVQLTPGKTKILDFCDATATTAGCGYGKVIVTYLSGSSYVEANLCQWSAVTFNPTINGPNGPCYGDRSVNTYGYWLASDGGSIFDQILTLTGNNSASWTLNVNNQQQLFLKNTGTATVYLSVSTYKDMFGQNPLGLPYVGSTSVTVNTLNASVGRRVQVIVPSTHSSSAGSAGPAPATHFSVSAPASVSRGFLFNFIVTALDASGSVVSGYTGTAHFTSTDLAANLPADSTLTNGVGIFSGTINTIGNYTITAKDLSDSTITGVSSSISASAPTNYALATNGGVAFASSLCDTCTTGSTPASAINDGDETGLRFNNGGVWVSKLYPPASTAGIYFSGAMTLHEVDVYTLSDNHSSDTTIYSTTTANAKGVRDYKVQYTTDGGTTWNDAPGGSITGNTLAWNKIVFSPAISSVNGIRIYMTKSNYTISLAYYYYLAEVEAY